MITRLSCLLALLAVSLGSAALLGKQDAETRNPLLSVLKAQERLAAQRQKISCREVECIPRNDDFPEVDRE